MFKALSGASSRAIASSSRPTVLLPTAAAQFHTTTPTHISHKRELANATRRRNLDFRAQRSALLAELAPHPVLGQPDTPSGEAAWRSCELARILVDEEHLHSEPPAPLDPSTIQPPEYASFALLPADERVIFQTLPALSAQTGLVGSGEEKRRSDEEMKMLLDKAVQRSQMQANYLARIVDLRNASARGIAYENRKRCVRAFGRDENDTGRPEVQAAILTFQIRNLWSHILTHHKDMHNKRSLKTLVHQRAKILKYLERLDPARYDALLPRLGLDPRAVKGEIIVKFPKGQRIN